MKRLALVVLVICAAAVFPASAGPSEEGRLIDVLQSASTLAEKEDACRNLKQIGTAKAVPALGRLLSDERLSQGARDALEGMPLKEVDGVLRAALKTTSGKTKLGIVHSLGARRDPRVSRELIHLLDDSDPLLASGAAEALGTIGGSKARRALLKAVAKTSDPVRSDIVDGLLQCAAALLAEGDRAQAAAIYRSLSAPTEKEHVRMAAHAGLIRAAGDRALASITADLQSGDPARESAALQLACNLQDPSATMTFTNLLQTACPAMQAAMLGMLQLRGDDAAAPAALRTAHNPDAAVRLAAIAALGSLGDETAVSQLAGAAASAEQAEQKVARQALADLHHGDVAQMMLVQLASASPAVQAELIRALASRAEKSAMPKLLELARWDQQTTRKAALQAIGHLADGSHLPALVKLIEETRDENIRSDVHAVFESIADRGEKNKGFDLSPILNGLATGNVDTRIALLQVSALFADDRLRAVLRAGLKDPDSQVRSAAGRAICSSRDMELMPDILELARDSENASIRALALEGYVRLITEEGSALSAPERVQLLKSACDIAKRPEDKRRVLSGLAEVSDPGALKLVAVLLEDTEVQKEAAQAAIKIAEALPPAQAREAGAAVLQRAASLSNDMATRKAVEIALKRISDLVQTPQN